MRRPAGCGPAGCRRLAGPCGCVLAGCRCARRVRATAVSVFPGSRYACPDSWVRVSSIGASGVRVSSIEGLFSAPNGQGANPIFLHGPGTNPGFPDGRSTNPGSTRWTRREPNSPAWSGCEPCLAARARRESLLRRWTRLEPKIISGCIPARPIACAPVRRPVPSSRTPALPVVLAIVRGCAGPRRLLGAGCSRWRDR